MGGRFQTRADAEPGCESPAGGRAEPAAAAAQSTIVGPAPPWGVTVGVEPPGGSAAGAGLGVAMGGDPGGPPASTPPTAGRAGPRQRILPTGGLYPPPASNGA